MARTPRPRKSNGPARDPYQDITDRILATMEEGGLAPWQRPWTPGPHGSAPRNPVSGTRYRGINVPLLLLQQWERGYDIPLFLTFKQANEVAAKAYRKAGVEVELVAVRGRKFWAFADGENKGKSLGGIREGQNQANGSGGCAIVFWARGERTEIDKGGEERSKSWMSLRTYTVFNVAQCDDIVREYLCPPITAAPEFTPLEACERICAEYAVDTRHGGDRACYIPSQDQIHLPHPETFQSPETYYTTRFHEMGHSTGHPSRLNREGIQPGQFRDVHTYAEEELVAEFTACFLAGEAGIVRTSEGNSAAYLSHWASKLREDKRLIVNAAQRAQKAADLILGRSVASVEAADEEASEAA